MVIEAGNACNALGRMQVGGQDLQDCGLTCPVRTRARRNLAGRNLKQRVLNGSEVAAELAEMNGLNRGRPHCVCDLAGCSVPKNRDGLGPLGHCPEAWAQLSPIPNASVRTRGGADGSRQQDVAPVRVRVWRQHTHAGRECTRCGGRAGLKPRAGRTRGGVAAPAACGRARGARQRRSRTACSRGPLCAGPAKLSAARVSLRQSPPRRTQPAP